MTPQPERAYTAGEVRRKEWVKGDAEDWVLLPVVKEPKSAKTPKAKGEMQRAHQIFTNWAFCGHAHGSPVAPKGMGCTCKGPVCTCGAETIEADVAIAEAALLAFGRFESAGVCRKTRKALNARHKDGSRLYGADVLNAERCYRLAIRIERGERP